MPSFQEQTSSFFDELEKIYEEGQRSRDQEQGRRESRPFSSMLTQDEEPGSSYYNPNTDEGEPEVIIRGQ